MRTLPAIWLSSSATVVYASRDSRSGSTFAELPGMASSRFAVRLRTGTPGDVPLPRRAVPVDGGRGDREDGQVRPQPPGRVAVPRGHIRGQPARMTVAERRHRRDLRPGRIEQLGGQPRTQVGQGRAPVRAVGGALG